MSLKLNQLSLVAAGNGIASGEFTSEQLVTACLERIHAREREVGAWVWLDPEQALAQARARDAQPAATALHGVPVGIKDIMNTVEMPTCYGSQVYSGHYPTENAECVRLLQQAGAVLMGKTVTTEFAFYAPGKTANPHNPAHTAGGSSSGSAAAVADFHVPLALGTQTSGSIIRPAAYTGIVGYKPTYDSYSLAGVHPLAPQLDTLGTFTRSVEDLTLAHNVLGRKHIQTPPAIRPARIALVRTPAWDDADAQTQRALPEFVERLQQTGAGLSEPDDALLQDLMAVQQDCLARGAVDSLGPVTDRHPQQVRPQTRALVAEGRRVDDAAFAARFQEALTSVQQFLDQVFAHADLIITPSAPGEAPLGLHNTGDPMFNRIWTFAGVPCINLPLLKGRYGLPIGVQLVCNKHEDERLLGYAAYLQTLIDYAG